MAENGRGASLADQEKRGHWREEAWDVVRLLLVSLAIVLPIRYWVVQPFIVRGASMEPNFEDREYLLIDELSYSFREPKRGEVIVFRYPRDTRQFFIKRVVGLPGERLEIRGGQLRIVNRAYPEGFTLDESYLLSPGNPTTPELTVTLGADEYFVLGDNRNFSSDSRVWGPLQRKFIMGRTLFRAWPLARFGPTPSEARNY